MLIWLKNPPKERSGLREMATRCHPSANGGRFPMWICVEYTDGEHNPPHAHLYCPDVKPSRRGLVTKFLITVNPPRTKADIQVMKGWPPMPNEYANMLIEWAKEKTQRGTNNWKALWEDWDGLEASFNAGLVR
jgi:hypothetical protein